MTKQICLQRIEQDKKRLERLRRQLVPRAERETGGNRSGGPTPTSTTWTTRFGASGKPPVA
jgi:hypothetical protein